jgi:hypothetical protein
MSTAHVFDYTANWLLLPSPKQKGMTSNAAFHPAIKTVGFQTAFSVKMLGLSVQTFRCWEKGGKIRAVRSPSNRWLFDVEEIKRLLGKPTGEAVDARVSSARHSDPHE